MLNIPVNSYDHVWTVSSSNHTFFLGKLDYAANQYFVRILLLVNDDNPSRISGKEVNGCRHYYMINLHESMRPGRDRTGNPRISSQTCICSQTHYRLGFTARLKYMWASTRKNVSSGVCEQHRRRPACASGQSDQRLCYSRFGRHHI